MACSRWAPIAAWPWPAADPDEMGIGPVFAIPKLLKQHGLSMSDIGIWELNEAFASQVLHIRDTLRHSRRAPERIGRRDLHRPSLMACPARA
ncbi:hypothetical protein ACU4GD_04815 [Cupriavidus basilensis]